MTARRVSVWAPVAKAVDLVAGDATCPMEESGGGWFAALNADSVAVWGGAGKPSSS